MSETSVRRDYLANYGATLIDQGYTIVPIQNGKKSPGFDGWQKSKATKLQWREWLDSGFKHAGVGILTKVTCGIDIDCLDEACAKHFEAWCLKNIGYAPVRVGKPPKRLLLYRTATPFHKHRSTIYLDEWGDKQMIEVLGDGQQFVAFHIHPETGRPYEWIDEKSPLTIRAADLTEVSEAQAVSLLETFDAYAKDQGWAVFKPSRVTSGAMSAGPIDKDNPWIEDSSPIEINIDELRARLLLVPNPEEYDRWREIGMCLHHQFDGDQVGFELWNEWSEAADNYDPDSLERHWKTFNIEGKKRAPLTARYILRLAKETIEKTSIEEGIKLRDAFINAKDLADWEKARQAARHAEIDGLARSALAVVAKDRRDAITGSRTSLVEIKKAIAFQPRKVDKAPAWCEHWIYDISQDRFFHLERKIAATKQGFDAMYDRQALTKTDILNGRSIPSQSASDLALNVFRIATVDGRRYMPGRDPIFHEPDGIFCNEYPEHEIPARPEKILPRDVRNIDRVKAHLKHLLDDPNQQRMFLDWMSWIVQNPGRHVNYAVLLQGVEGDGKSFFGEMLRAVMGVSNVAMSNGNTIIKSDFTSWAYGQCVCCIEEVRLVNTKGVDKWDAINKIKPFISNNVIEIHPKGKDAFNVINTTSYLLFSNFRDALPLDENSRRYLVLFSRWQHKKAIEAFKREHPNYYVRLYETLSESAGALRQWLLDHQPSDDFNPLGDAPDTAARTTMIRKSKPEFIQVLDDIIAEDQTLEASEHLLDTTGLSDVMVAAGVDWPGPKALATMLERDGYESLGKVSMHGLGKHTCYSKTPDMFYSQGYQAKSYIDTYKIRDYIKQRSDRLNSDL